MLFPISTSPYDWDGKGEKVSSYVLGDVGKEKRVSDDSCLPLHVHSIVHKYCSGLYCYVAEFAKDNPDVCRDKVDLSRMCS